MRRIMGLYLYATGCQRQVISVLSTMGFSESYSNLVMSNIRRETKKPENLEEAETRAVSEEGGAQASQKEAPRYSGTLRQLSSSVRTKTRSIAAVGLYGGVFDNINIMYRAPEQVIGRHGGCLTCKRAVGEIVTRSTFRFPREWNVRDTLSVVQGPSH